MARRIVTFLIDGYRRFISPLLPPACRFHPSCSAYAREAVSLHGVCGGGVLAVWRLLRCHPYHPGGVDPVPGRLPWSRAVRPKSAQTASRRHKG